MYRYTHFQSCRLVKANFENEPKPVVQKAVTTSVAPDNDHSLTDRLTTVILRV